MEQCQECGRYEQCIDVLQKEHKKAPEHTTIYTHYPFLNAIQSITLFRGNESECCRIQITQHTR